MFAGKTKHQALTITTITYDNCLNCSTAIDLLLGEVFTPFISICSFYFHATGWPICNQLLLGAHLCSLEKYNDKICSPETDGELS